MEIQQSRCCNRYRKIANSLWCHQVCTETHDEPVYRGERWEHRFLSLQHQQLLPKNHNLGKQALGPSRPDKPEQ